MRLPTVFGKKRRVPKDTPTRTHIGICGQCGEGTKTLYQWGRKWLDEACYKSNLSKVKAS